jgi:hypothetical protein
MSSIQTTPAPVEEKTFCAMHPDRETSLRCNKCERYMCPDCAVLTPVGYRCKQCVRQIEDKFFTGTQSDYGLIFAACFGLTLLGGVVISFIGLFLILIFLLAIPAAGGISEVALRLVQRRRGRQSAYVAAAGAFIGGALAWPVYLFLRTGVLVMDPRVLFNIETLIFAGIVAAVVYSRFQMRI